MNLPLYTERKLVSVSAGLLTCILRASDVRANKNAEREPPFPSHFALTMDSHHDDHDDDYMRGMDAAEVRTGTQTTATRISGGAIPLCVPCATFGTDRTYFSHTRFQIVLAWAGIRRRSSPAASPTWTTSTTWTAKSRTAAQTLARVSWPHASTRWYVAVTTQQVSSPLLSK